MTALILEASCVRLILKETNFWMENYDAEVILQEVGCVFLYLARCIFGGCPGVLPIRWL